MESNSADAEQMLQNNSHMSISLSLVRRISRAGIQPVERTEAGVLHLDQKETQPCDS